jgi:hypothetical protein
MLLGNGCQRGEYTVNGPQGTCTSAAQKDTRHSDLSGRLPFGIVKICDPPRTSQTGSYSPSPKRTFIMLRLLCLATLAFASAFVSVYAAKDSTITTKVFFDIEMDGKPAGKLETPLSETNGTRSHTFAPICLYTCDTGTLTDERCAHASQ